MRARLGGLTTSALGHVTTEAARAKFLSRFEPSDPGLSPVERARRAEAAKRLYFGRLALKSSLRRKRKAAPVGQMPGTARADGHGDGIRSD